MDSRRPSLEAHLGEEGKWTYLRLGPGKSLPLPFSSLKLPVEDPYRGVNLEEGWRVV